MQERFIVVGVISHYATPAKSLVVIRDMMTDRSITRTVGQRLNYNLPHVIEKIERNDVWITHEDTRTRLTYGYENRTRDLANSRIEEPIWDEGLEDERREYMAPEAWKNLEDTNWRLPGIRLYPESKRSNQDFEEVESLIETP